MDREFKRNVVHLIFGTVVAVSVLIFSSTALLSTGIIIIAGLVIAKLCEKHEVFIFSYLLKQMERENALIPGQGVLSFFIGAFISLLFFPVHIVFYSILILAFLDSFSTVFGKAFGRIRIYKKKTVIGTASGFLSAFLLMILLTNVKAAFFSSLAASLVELFSPFDDNVVLPPVVSLVLYLLL